MATIPEVTKVLVTAAAVYPNFKMQVTPEQFATAWHRHVGHLSAAQLQAAMDRAVAGTEFFPTVSDVLKAAGQLAAGEGKTALEAWAVVQRAMVIHGNYHGPKGTPNILAAGNYEWVFDDDKIQAAVTGIGWQQLFDGDMDVMRSHFVRAYDAMRLRELQHAVALPAPEPVKELAPHLHPPAGAV